MSRIFERVFEKDEWKIRLKMNKRLYNFDDRLIKRMKLTERKKY